MSESVNCNFNINKSLKIFEFFSDYEFKFKDFRLK